MFEPKTLEEESQQNIGPAKPAKTAPPDYIDNMKAGKNTPVKVDTTYGTFSQLYFGSVYTEDGADNRKIPIGANMYMTFTPNSSVNDAKQSGFIQQAKYTKNNTAQAPRTDIAPLLDRKSV